MPEWMTPEIFGNLFLAGFLVLMVLCVSTKRKKRRPRRRRDDRWDD